MVATPALAEPHYLSGLNAPQRQAVLTTEGPVLILAGAGTGKTRALTTRLAHILSTRLAWPSEILCVTFTNKAAREMQHRMAALLGGNVGGQGLEILPFLGTFHAVAARMLRRHAALVGLDSNFTILDTDDQQRLMKQVLIEAQVDDKRWPAKLLAGHIDRFKNRGLTPAQVPAGEAQEFAAGKVVELYARYQERLIALNAADFGDLLLHMLTIFLKHPDVLAQYQQRFKYVLVDEYQDTNVAQYLWLRLLAQTRRNIACVGDDDQSIYSWRGAEVANILRFEKDFPGATVIRLEQNYRSTPHILAAAGGLIAHNGDRLGKTLWTAAAGGEKLAVIGVWDGPEEARRVGERLEALQRDGVCLNDCAILVRAQFQTREFEDRFITIGLPYKIVGGFRFYERAEIRDALAYLRVVASPADSLAFERIINTPKRGLGDKALQRLHALARAQNRPLASAANAIIQTDELTPAARRALAALMHDIARWRDQLGSPSASAPAEAGLLPGPDRGRSPGLSHPELARVILEESGYLAMWQNDKSPEAAGRVDNLLELTRAMEDFESLTAFL
ncbi:MAG: ATP-dependent helicase, partial [Polymorphobacter sp.]